MTADNPPKGAPAESDRAVAAKRVELAVTASAALTKLADSMAPHELGFAASNGAALRVDALVKTLRGQVPR